MLAKAVRKAVRVLALMIARGEPVGDRSVSVPVGEVALSVVAEDGVVYEPGSAVTWVEGSVFEDMDVDVDVVLAL